MLDANGNFSYRITRQRFKYIGAGADLAGFGWVEHNQIVDFDGELSGVDWQPVELPELTLS